MAGYSFGRERAFFVFLLIRINSRGEKTCKPKSIASEVSYSEAAKAPH